MSLELPLGWSAWGYGLVRDHKGCVANNLETPFALRRFVVPANSGRDHDPRGRSENRSRSSDRSSFSSWFLRFGSFRSTLRRFSVGLYLGLSCSSCQFLIEFSSSFGSSGWGSAWLGSFLSLLWLRFVFVFFFG